MKCKQCGTEFDELENSTYVNPISASIDTDSSELDSQIVTESVGEEIERAMRTRCPNCNAIFEFERKFLGMPPAVFKVVVYTMQIVIIVLALLLLFGVM